MEMTRRSTIETADGLHVSRQGIDGEYRSFKEIVTDLPDEVNEEPPQGVTAEDHKEWCKAYLDAAHDYDIAVAEAYGRAAVAEDAELARVDLDELLQHAHDMEDQPEDYRFLEEELEAFRPTPAEIRSWW